MSEIVVIQVPTLVASYDDVEARFRKGSALFQHKFLKVAATISALYRDELTPRELSRDELTMKELYRDKLTPNKSSRDQLTPREQLIQTLTHWELSRDDLTPRQLSRDVLTPRQLSRDELTPRELSRDKLTPREPFIQTLTPIIRELSREEPTPRELSRDQLTPMELSRNELNPRELSRDQLTWRDLSSDTLTPRNLSRDELAQRELSRDELIPREQSRNELPPRELSRDKLTPREQSRDALTPNELSGGGRQTFRRGAPSGANRADSARKHFRRNKRASQRRTDSTTDVELDDYTVTERQPCLAAEAGGVKAEEQFPEASWTEQRFRRGSGTLQRHFLTCKQPELIFSGEYTKTMESEPQAAESFHKEHLACNNCDKKLVACRYIMREEKPHCVPCYQQMFAHNCEECTKPIGPDFKDLSYKERHWHEFCFKCSQCQKSLVDQPFAPKNDNIFCSECYDNTFAARCDGCTNPFRGGMKKFEYKGKQWHDECFTCGECSQPIGNKSFIPREERVICVPCYETNYAQKCSKCTGVINKGGISYKNTPWHRECFTCTNCSKVLAGEKFTSKDEQPYCGDCFGELFAKRCCRCTKAITGIGGTKFISFEERHWHSDCFVCYKCDASMVGRGFLMNADEILCPDCGRS